MIKLSPLMIYPPVVIAGLALFFYIGMQGENPGSMSEVPVERSAPAVVLKQLGQQKVFDDNTLREDGVKLVNFWASWCVPCRVEHPNLKAMADDGIKIYGVNYKDTEVEALKFLEEFENPYTLGGADPQGKMANNWGVYGLPETLIIDSKGNIVFRFVGPITQRVLKGQIRPAIEAAQ